MASLRMQSCCFFILALCFLASNFAQFTDIFEPDWAIDHFMLEGELLKLKLNKFFGISSQDSLSNITMFLQWFNKAFLL